MKVYFVSFGEQFMPLGKRILPGLGPHAASRHAGSTSHLFGMLPARQANAKTSINPESHS